MSIVNNLNIENSFVKDVRASLPITLLIHQSLYIESHADLMLWLQSDVQQYLPHKAMIAAWGDFSSGSIYIDVISASSDIKSSILSNTHLSVFLQNLFKRWHDHSKSPYMLSIEKGIFSQENAPLDYLSSLNIALIHGVKDYRGGHDYLYMFLSDEHNVHKDYRKTISVFTPFIDSTLRQLQYIPNQLSDLTNQQREYDEIRVASTLSDREFEVMTWVKMGKTNQEIGLILGISTFTVKNHLQRIFKKLNVINRTQAVTQFNRAYQIQ